MKKNKSMLMFAVAIAILGCAVAGAQTKGSLGP